MKLHAILLPVFLLASSSVAQTGTQAQATFNVETVRLQAVTNGMMAAEQDFSNGVYRIQTLGLTAAIKDPADLYLEQNYQVTNHVVAGCDVTPEILGHAEGYNERMKQRLLEKHGKDIFREADAVQTNRAAGASD